MNKIKGKFKNFLSNKNGNKTKCMGHSKSIFIAIFIAINVCQKMSSQQCKKTPQSKIV
jgi:hypothetical protein